MDNITTQTMLLIRHSQRAANAVRTASPRGQLFVASVVICMILASFGDAVDPALFGEAGLEFALFDLGGELSILAMRHWYVLQLLLAGALLAAGFGAMRLLVSAIGKAMRPGPRDRPGKVPI